MKIIKASRLQVASRCFQLLTSVFQAPPSVAVPYIQALGPTLVRFLQVLRMVSSAFSPYSPQKSDIFLEHFFSLKILTLFQNLEKEKK